MNVNIERWHKTLGKLENLRIEGDKYEAGIRAASVSGWYADYSEGRFAFWLDQDKQYVSWKKKRIELYSSSVINWQSTIKGRRFEIYQDEVLQIKINYRTLIRRPWAVFTDLLLPDDDWGLECDLPSFIHSHHLSGELGVMVARMNERKMS